MFEIKFTPKPYPACLILATLLAKSPQLLVNYHVDECCPVRQLYHSFHFTSPPKIEDILHRFCAKNGPSKCGWLVEAGRTSLKKGKAGRSQRPPTAAPSSRPESNTILHLIWKLASAPSSSRSLALPPEFQPFIRSNTNTSDVFIKSVCWHLTVSGVADKNPDALQMDFALPEVQYSLYGKAGLKLLQQVLFLMSPSPLTEVVFVAVDFEG